MSKVIQLLDSRSFGGIETHVLNLCDALKRQSIDSEVWFLTDYGPHPLEEKLTCKKISYQKHSGSKEVWKKLRRSNDHVLHTHGYKAGVIGRVFATLLGTPVVSTFHSGDDGTGRVWFYNKLDQMTSFLGHSISVSREIANKLPFRSTLVSNFVALPEFSERQWNGRIAFVGRLSHEKGPDLFCQIASEFPSERPVIFGDGPLKEDLFEKYGSQVEFKGQVKDMDNYWRDIDLLCLTSRHEGLPLVALEAMSRGIPVIAFSVGGLPDLIQNHVNGHLIPAGDIVSFKQAVGVFVGATSPQKREISSNAYKTIAEAYSEAALLPKICSIYNLALTKAISHDRASTI